MTHARVSSILSSLILACAAMGSPAQEYPTRVIRWVVPYAAGGDLYRRRHLGRAPHRIQRHVRYLPRNR